MDELLGKLKEFQPKLEQAWERTLNWLNEVLTDIALWLVKLASWVLGLVERAREWAEKLLQEAGPEWQPVLEIVETVPAWLVAAFGTGVVGLIVVLFLGLTSRRRSRLDKPVYVSPKPATADTLVPFADAGAPPSMAGSFGDPVKYPGKQGARDQSPGTEGVDQDELNGDVRGPEAEEADDPVDAAELEGLAELLEEQGLSPAEADTEIRAFAADLDALRLRLQALKGQGAERAALLHKARSSIASGDLRAGIEYLTDAADREASHGQEHLDTAQLHTCVASHSRIIAGDLLLAQHAHADAMTYFRAAADVAPPAEPELKVESLNKLGTAAHLEGDHASAIEAFSEALDLMEAALGDSHPELSTLLNNLALAQDLAGDLKTAEDLYQRALVIDEKALGTDHPDVAIDLNNLGLLYRRQGKLLAAEPLLRRALRVKEQVYDDRHPKLVNGLKNYADVLRAMGRDQDAEVFEVRAGIEPRRVETAVAE